MSLMSHSGTGCHGGLAGLLLTGRALKRRRTKPSAGRITKRRFFQPQSLDTPDSVQRGVKWQRDGERNERASERTLLSQRRLHPEREGKQRREEGKEGKKGEKSR